MTANAFNGRDPDGSVEGVDRSGVTAGGETEVANRRPRRQCIASALWPVAGSTLIGAAVLDVISRAADTRLLWLAGAHLLTAGVALAFATGLIALFRRARRWHTAPARRMPRWTTALAATAVALAALARWVRGHHEIPPDLPIVAAEVVAAAMIAAALSRRARFP